MKIVQNSFQAELSLGGEAVKATYAGGVLTIEGVTPEVALSICKRVERIRVPGQPKQTRKPRQPKVIAKKPNGNGSDEAQITPLVAKVPLIQVVEAPKKEEVKKPWVEDTAQDVPFFDKVPKEQQFVKEAQPLAAKKKKTPELGSAPVQLVESKNLKDVINFFVAQGTKQVDALIQECVHWHGQVSALNKIKIDEIPVRVKSVVEYLDIGA